MTPFTNKTRFRTWKLAAVGATASVLLLAGCSGGSEGSEGGEGETFTLKYSTVLNENHFYSKAFQKWMDRVTEATDGQVQFEAFYNASLCSQADAVDCAESGTADIVFVAANQHQELAANNVGFIPFQTLDYRAIPVALTQLAEEYPEMDEEYAQRNQKRLFFTSGDPVIVAMNKQTTPEKLSDLAGMQIGASSLIGIAMDQLGASPVAVAPEDIYDSLERNLIQGQVYTLSTVAAQGILEVAPNVYGLNDAGIQAANNFNINLDTYERLPESARKAMDDASRAMHDDDILGSEIDAALVTSCQAVADLGGTVGTLGGDATGEQWKEDSLKVIVERFKENATGKISDVDAFVARYMELVAEYKDPDALSLEQHCEAAGV
ncbi:TRAP transporter substrate-binding protein DctP [Microbacterium sp. No. 7]|uniref:TRAP transporter substrate-binding protein DctP n=1 Tax=Microbacterium sp. No. 7 TaxID=1714373 RepID=UPI0006D1BF5F|nr:TRAP transporter substrate-binding protein DctP [Microbacterium sp. No. 7]ALJ18397.1 hypothetical protein AOA12_00055 [Microbacterium sp. No. 7]